MQPLDIVVIADDLTGGADTGVQFCPGLGPVYLTSGFRGRIEREALAGRAVALYTNSRHVAPDEAARRVRDAYVNIAHLSPVCVYKKIDSCMRGNIGAEIDSLLLQVGSSFSFVAPALPGQGRTTEKDIHMVNGVPVADTEVAADPLCPVTESRLSVLLGNQSRMPVGRVDLSVVNKGIPAMAETVAQLGTAGCRHIVFDATETRHLDCIIRLARDHFNRGDVLFVGSAGLAASLAAEIAARKAPQKKPSRPRIDRWLFVCGSASATMARQLKVLIDHTSWAQITVKPDRKSPAAAGESEGRGIHFDVGSYSGRNLVVSVDAPEGQTADACSPALTLKRLVEVAYALVEENPPQGLFLSGGDTAEAVLERIGASGVVMHEEITSGLMLGEVSGGMCHALPVVTKAGSFGTETTLVELIKLFDYH